MLREQILRTSRNAREVQQGKRDWFRFENKGNGEADVYIYDEISWFGITASDFLNQLASVDAKTINLHLNSPGGDVFDGIAIYNALKQRDGTVNVFVDSIAASIASVIAMAGDTITMARGSMMMIHEPFALVIGDAADMRKQAEALDLMAESIAGIYAAAAGPRKPKMPDMSSTAYWRGLMSAETWFGAQDACDCGLADSMSGEEAAKAAFDLSIFRNGPKADSKSAEPVTKEPARVTSDWRRAALHSIAAAELEVA